MISQFIPRSPKAQVHEASALPVFIAIDALPEASHLGALTTITTRQVVDNGGPRQKARLDPTALPLTI